MDCSCEGKICKDCQKLKCHGDFYTYITRSKNKNRVLEPRCKICSKARRKAWENATPERAEKYKKIKNDNARRWQKENPEKTQEYKNNWNKNNPEKLKAYRKTYHHNWWKNNPERVKKYIERRKANYERFLERQRLHSMRYRLKYGKRDYEKHGCGWMRWHKRHPGMRRIQNSLRRSRIHQAEGSYTIAEWENLKELYDYRCLCCGRREPEIELTADHVHPIAIGGSNKIENIQPLCKHCNSRKSTKIIDFRAQNT